MQPDLFANSRTPHRRLDSRRTAGVGLICLLLTLCMPAGAATLDHVKETGHIRFGYVADGYPFSFRNESGNVDGYAVALCQQIAEHVRSQLKMPQLAIDWKPVEFSQRLREVQDGNIDLLCIPISETLSWRSQVSFSLPIFPGGNRAVLRSDARVALRDAFESDQRTRPVWRGMPAATVLTGTKLAVVSGTSSEKWINSRRQALQVDATIVPVPDYRTGLQQLIDRKVDVFFGERSIVLGALHGMDPSARQNVVILERMFTHERLALALPRNESDFRLMVDTALSQAYESTEFGALYRKWFGEFGDQARIFFMWNTLPQ